MTNQPRAWTLSANPQSRYQVTENIANQTEATYKFNIGRLEEHGPGRRRSFARDRQHRQICRLELGSAAGWIQRHRLADRREHLQPSIHVPAIQCEPTSLTGLPTKIAIDTTSAYLIDTANYNDFVILNGGIRYDDYNIKASGFGTVNNRAERVQCAGAAIRPAELQSRPDAEAAAEWQRLCRLCDLVESGRLRIRWHQRAIWRPGAVR